MNQIEQVFWEEFKRLDKLCKEIYGSPQDGRLGVTWYLEDMEKHSRRGSALVQNWTSDYALLKKLRKARNELSHEAYPPSYSVTQTDIQFIRSFYVRIMNRTDPLAILKKQELAHQPRSTHTQSSTYSQSSTPPVNIPRKKQPYGCFPIIAAFVVLTVLIIGLFI